MPTAPAPTLRLLSYNVRSLRDDPHAAADVIRAAAPDVVCVQEAPRFARWRSRCAALAREAGLLVVTGGRPAGAMLLLADQRMRVVHTRNVLLSRRRGLHQRGLAIAVLEAERVRYTVASMHLDLVATERARHAAEVLDLLAGYEAPLLLAGDVNEEPDGPAWAMLALGLQDAFAVAGDGPGATYSAREPRQRIDAVFVDSRLRVLACSVPTPPGRIGASDHLPVLATVTVTPEAPAPSSAAPGTGPRR